MRILKLFPFCLSAILLIAVMVPGCMKRNKASLDGGHLIRNDQETHWEPEYFPLTVFVDKNMPDHLIVGMYDAINAWNVSTGVSVFEPVLMDFDLDLPRDCGWVAAVQKPLKTAGKWRGVEKPGTGKLCAGEVSLDVGTIHKFSAKLWIHELGHSLGLAHDHGDNRSIMYPTVFSDSPQYIMPDDAVSVRTMVLGTFVPMDADLKSQLYKYLEAL